MLDTATISNAVLIITTLVGMYIAAFWLALIIWTYRDHRARSRDGMASVTAALMVTVLGLPGLLIYLLLRPKETLSEAYERSLEEEALLQEIEEKPICPGCGRPADEDWQVCPHCHTSLRKPCIACDRLLELAWHQCPYCATVQPNLAAPQQEPRARQPQVRPAQPPLPEYTPQVEQPLEYIDNDPYQA